MRIYTEIIGNINSAEWVERAKDSTIESIVLDGWSGQKSRFVARSDRGGEYAVSLARGHRLSDGDIIEYEPTQRHMVIIRLRLSDVLVVDLGLLVGASPETIIRTAVELGHAIGNQHWAAVVKSTKVYIPMVTERRVMQSVMRTHNIEGLRYDFRPASEVIPYLAPHEIRRLFGASAQQTTEHQHNHKHHELHEPKHVENEPH